MYRVNCKTWLYAGGVIDYLRTRGVRAELATPYETNPDVIVYVKTISELLAVLNHWQFTDIMGANL